MPQRIRFRALARDLQERIMEAVVELLAGLLLGTALATIGVCTVASGVFAVKAVKKPSSAHAGTGLNK